MSTTIEHVSWSAPEDARDGTTLVVALHGRGADETSMAGLVGHLPENMTLASVRAPIAEGGGYAWFANRGIGRPLGDSINESARAMFAWLEQVSGAHRQVVLLGFSGGTAMAGALLFDEPERFAGAALLSGTLPWDAGLDAAPGRFAGIKIFWGNDEADEVIPRDLMERSETRLRGESGADLTVRHYPGLGHGVSAQELRDVQQFLVEVTVDRA